MQPDRSTLLPPLKREKSRFIFGLIFLFSLGFLGFLSIRLEEGALCGSVFYARIKFSKKEGKGKLILSTVLSPASVQ